MKQVLIVEDDKNIVDLLEIHLKDMDCQIVKTYNGEEGLSAAQKNLFDLIILDLMLPRMDGLDVCRELRSQKINTPILMLTAKSEEIDKVLGLESGADDYLSKPFGVREFIARVKALLRRARIANQETDATNSKVLEFDDLSIDIDKKKVTLGEQRINISPKEFELLVLLASNPGKSYTRKRILNMVWGYDFEGYEHTVNSHINRLRSKVEKDLNNPKFILTTWGIGYRFNEDI